MKCQNHPQREALAICQKYNEAYCVDCCACRHPHGYCKFRTQCGNWPICQKKRRNENKI